jgi:hypothetical protein
MFADRGHWRLGALASRGRRVGYWIMIKLHNFNIAIALAHVSRNALDGSFDRHAQHAPWYLVMVGQVRDIYRELQL